MWRKEEPKSQGTAEPAVPPSASIPQSGTPGIAGNAPIAAVGSALPVSPRAVACITQGIRVKGEIIGKEDLFIDGTLEGKLDIGNASCTVGPNGKVKADISAREVIVRGNVDGKIDGTERVQVWSTGRVAGEVRTERLAIEDGAVLRGKVEAGKPRALGAEAQANNTAAKPEKSKSGSADAASRAAVI
jgi:cytoskeletal protein CcmA (bactofilin family)